MSKILGSKYSISDVLRNAFSDMKDVAEHVDCKVLSPENSKSFWSLIARLELAWHSAEDRKKLPSSLFIKLPTITENALMTNDPDDIDDLKVTLLELTLIELLFYRKMKGKTVPGFPFPKVYYADDIDEKTASGGCLVLEDFSGTASSVDYIPGFSIPQVECMMDALAAWHASVFVDSTGLIETFDRSNEIDYGFQTFMFQESMRLEGWHPEWFAGRISGLEEYFSTEHAVRAQQCSSQIGIPPVLVHMDLNTTNVLWRNDGTTNAPKLAAIIDFQQVHAGNLCEDLARVIMLSISRDERRIHTDRLLARYHARLEAILGKQNAPVTLEQVRVAYRCIFPYVANFTLFAATAYYQMYERIEQKEEIRRAKQQELLSRAKGIVDDFWAIVEKKQ